MHDNCTITRKGWGGGGGEVVEKGGRDISCFAWDTGPNRRCSAWGTFAGCVTAATGFLLRSVVVKRAVTQSFLKSFGNIGADLLHILTLR